MFRIKICLLAVLMASYGASAQLIGGPSGGGGGPSISHQVFWETEGVHAGESARAVLEFRLSEGWHVNAHEPLEEFLIGTTLKLEEQPGLTVESVVYPEPKVIQLAFAPDQPMAVYEEVFLIGVVVQVAADLAPGEQVLKGSLAWQACNDTQCAMPKTLALEIPLSVRPAGEALAPGNAALFEQLDWTSGEARADEAPDEAPADTPALSETPGDWRALADQFRVVGREGYVDAETFIAFIQAGKRGEDIEENPLARMGLWALIVAILAGGLALNLTPCVLPLIPINIAIIGAGAQAGSRGRGFALGSAYGIAIALVYGALGLLVVLGLSNAFGAINSTLWFNLGITLLFVILALAMVDIIPIDFSRFQAKFGIRKNENGSFLIAFAMGGISALLAGACVAPVVIFVLLLAQDQYAQGNQAAVLLPFLLGLGMALPWPFAGAGLSFLPKPGKWMTKVKYVFGVFMICVAAYYGFQSYTIFADRYLVDEDAVRASMEAADEHGWVHSLEQGMAEALAENKPVLIDFWATWCKTCLVMNETVLKDPAVLAELENVVKIKYQAQDPSLSPVKDVWEHYDLVGLPTYIMLQPK